MGKIGNQIQLTRTFLQIVYNIFDYEAKSLKKLDSSTIQNKKKITQIISNFPVLQYLTDILENNCHNTL